MAAMLFKTNHASKIAAIVTYNVIQAWIHVEASGGNVFSNLVIYDGAVNTYYYPVVTQTELPEFDSNCFTYIDDTCFTTVIKYRSNENSFSLFYTGDTAFHNAVRLPLFINNPQPVSDENVFRLSDGSKKTLFARFEKEYEGQTDYMDENFHFKLAIALKHDFVYLGDDYGTVNQYIQEGKYEIGWLNKPGTNYDSAPANFKVRTSPYFQVNSNCI